MVNIKRIESKKEFKEFIDFPHDLYADDENYVPELFQAQKELLDKNNPFFDHSEADFFLAYRNGEIIGRVAAIKNNNYIKYTGKPTGKFGFFDVIEDYEVAKALLDAVVEWIKERGLTRLQGPENYSTNETCGTLIEGFDSPPTVMMTFNKSYYGGYLEKYGLKKDMDLLSYIIYTKDVPEKLLRMSSKILNRLNTKGITIRKVNLKKFKEELEKIFLVYNAAWEKNWGFVPMTKAEFVHAAKDMKQIINPDFMLIAEDGDKPIGFSLSIPDINVAFKKMKKGRLFPFGIFKFLYYKRKIDRVRIVTLGILEDYRKLGIDACFYAMAFNEAKKKNIMSGEASWILENNEMMNRAIKSLGGTVYKTHRLYEMAI